jgi:putative ABC transport system permease protein
MFRNYFKIAIRNLTKFKGYAAINIAGLAIGIACCLLIVQFMRIETSYDKHHVDRGKIFRVTTEFDLGARQMLTGTTPSPFARAIAEDFAEVEESARLLKAPGVDKFLLKYEDKSFFEENGYYADSTIFEILTYDFVGGDPATALDEPFSVVISSNIAKKAFGSDDPIGKTITLENLWASEDFKVTGVFNPHTYRSHIDGNFYMSLMSGRVGKSFYALNEWGGNNMFYTYIKLRKDSDPNDLIAKLPVWLDGYAGARLKEMGFTKKHDLEPISSIYLHSDTAMPLGPTGNINYVYLLGAIAIFILFIACINFMNLSTAEATVRAHEVGVRKVIGATRAALSKQFLSEAFIYSSISVLLALFIANLVALKFGEMAGKPIQVNILKDGYLTLWLVGIVALTTFVAGSYPALYLSSFSPVNIFRGQLGSRFSTKQIRRGLVVIQFIISIALIQGALVVNNQLEYCQQKDLGFNPQAKLIIPLSTPQSSDNYQPLKALLMRNPVIAQAGGTSVYPGKSNIEDALFLGEGQIPEQGSITFRHYVDPDYMALMHFKLLEGRMFSEDRIADSAVATIITETLVNNLGYTRDNAVGKTMYFDWGGQRFTYNIIGVVKDFHSTSLYSKLEGEAFFWDHARSPNFLVADIQSGDIPTAISLAEEAWDATNPAEPFEFYFLDEQLQQNYLASERMSGLIIWGTALAIFISCLGLLGLVSFAAERRRKEFGVRRILGASTQHIIGLMSRDFLFLVIVALFVASPIAWYVTSNWLQEFQFHISMPWWIYVVAGLAATMIALVTVAVQTLRSQAVNPVESLRTE